MQPDERTTPATLDQARGLLEARRFDAAARLYAQVLAREPGNAGAWFLHGVALAEHGDLAAARTSLARSFALEPAQAPPHHLVHANILLDAPDPAGAEAQARAALAQVPDWPPALVTLALAVHRQGRMAEAHDALRRALERDPDYVRAHSALGATLSDAGRHAEAVAALRASVARFPSGRALREQLAEALARWGRALEDEARVFDAIDRYREALALDDAQPDCWNALGNACANAGLLPQAQEAYRETLARKPDYHQVESNLLVNLHYDPRIDAAAMFEAHRAWAARHAAALAPAARVAIPARTGAGKLRVGFLSPALRDGPTATFLAPLLAHLDRSRFEIHGYPVAGSVDATTQRLQACCDAWHDVRGQDDETVARRIRDAGIHILVDLAGHTPGGRLLVLARKPAPVIATWLDYFDTTGLETVDYLVSDAVSTPPGGSQRFTEKVVDLAPSRFCYAPPPYAPQPAPAPALRNGFVTFGSFNRLPKLAPPVVALWSAVLAAVPASRLLLKNAALADARMREEIVRRFGRHGIDAQRLELRAHSPHEAMLREYGDVDIALDPFPYNGGLTTCEALWMGVPVVSIAGASMISRQGASVLHAAGLDDWIAASEADFLRIAVERAADAPALARLRAGLRARVSASPLVDGPAFARRFADALVAMWERSTAGA